MAKLKAAQRKKIPNSQFARPGKGKGMQGKGPGACPIHDLAHARAALRLCAKYPGVKEKVYRKYPELRPKRKTGTRKK
jgi:hypothetical protein